MRGPNFFDAGKFPEAQFVATSISGSGNSYEARGRIIVKRLDFGVGQNEWAATGQVANEVTVDLNLVAGRAK